MPQDEKNSTNIPQYIPLVAGGVSGVVTRFLFQPLDVVKIRFQLQVEPISKQSVESKYKSIPQAVRLIIKEEGVLALWKGHIPAQLLSLTFGIVQFGTYEPLVKQLKRFPSLADKMATVEFVGGFTAGSFATIVTSPFDIVRTRLIIQGNSKMYSSTLHGLKHILQHEGFRGYFRGLTPSLMQIGPLSGIQFATYHFYKRIILAFGSRREVDSKWFSVSGTAAAGFLSGFTAKLVTYPLDLFRKRMQFQGFHDARKGFGKNFTCSDLTSCLTETLKAESSFGLFKGLSPSLLKASLVNALIFTIYEETQRLLLDLHGIIV